MWIDDEVEVLEDSHELADLYCLSDAAEESTTDTRLQMSASVKWLFYLLALFQKKHRISQIAIGTLLILLIFFTVLSFIIHSVTS